MTFQRVVAFEPAFDKRSDQPSKNYGIHGMQIRFTLKGERGAVQWLCYTGWHLPHVQREKRNWQQSYDREFNKVYPQNYDLGYHSPTPHYEGQTRMSEKCEILDGPCYYDGSGLNGEPFVEMFLREGDTAVWRELERYYAHVFEEIRTW